MAKYVLSQRDHSNEISSSQMNVDPTISRADRDALNSAIDAVTLGVLSKDTLSDVQELSGAIPSSVLAQREVKGLVGVRDTITGNPYTFTLPCWDLSNQSPPQGSEFIPLGATPEMTTLVSALEAHTKSPVGNPVTVDYIKFVGRST